MSTESTTVQTERKRLSDEVSNDVCERLSSVCDRLFVGGLSQRIVYLSIGVFLRSIIVYEHVGLCFFGG